jgi:hypothetical protein
LDEWHANKYPDWIHTASNGRMKVTYAYGKVDSPTGLSNAEWCEQKGIQLLGSIEEVVAKSDYIIVLSPDYPEFHEELSMLPLQSGKPTYVDKTFAPDRATALRLFETAERHGTPVYSSSALRFASEYTDTDKQGIETILSIGPGKYNNYSVHQVEPIIALMGSNATRVMFTGTSHTPSLLIGFADGRQATINHFGGDCPFSMVLNYESGNAKVIKVESNFFNLFIQNMVEFFEHGKTVVDKQETITIMSVIEYGAIAATTPHQWVNLPTG